MSGLWLTSWVRFFLRNRMVHSLALPLSDRFGEVVTPINKVGASTRVRLLFQAPFVPTTMGVASKMLSLAKLRPGERMCDLGCGDGKSGSQ